MIIYHNIVMGIPSMFSFIVKNHPSIIKRYVKNVLKVDNLYLDCNSIIYDAYSKMEFDKLTESVAISIIRRVILKIEDYISEEVLRGELLTGLNYIVSTENEVITITEDKKPKKGKTKKEVD